MKRPNWLNILILGAGGREHALAWKLRHSPRMGNLYVAPGNAGTAGIAKNIAIDINDFDTVKKIALKEEIDLVIVGPEDPLVNGIHDFFLLDAQISHIPVIGPQKAAAELEGSKEFAKEFMLRHAIPTAAYQSFTADTLDEGQTFLETLNPPYVLKADGLAAGKGVVILDDLQDAKSELRSMLVDAKFGQASTTVVIEEFLSGIELSIFVLTDGKGYKILPTAKDYKRIGEGDTGLNTGGMGAISPVPFVDEEFMEKIHRQIVRPTIEGLQKDNLPYQGFIFIGLIKVGDEPKVIEYNVRMGDPETEVVIPRIKSDLVSLFEAVVDQSLDNVDLEIDERTAATVMLVSGGYPEAYEKGKEISGLEAVKNTGDEANADSTASSDSTSLSSSEVASESLGSSLIFHAGTKLDNGKISTNGGRVMAITSYGENFKDALKTSYKTIQKIDFEGMNYRKDIGFDL